jgi:hypothetical protein
MANICSIEQFDGSGDGYIDIVLSINYQGFKIEISPENQQEICNIDIGAESGSFDTRPWNGGFSFSWSPSKLIFDVARCGDGNGGGIKFEMPTTPQLLESFHRALTKWKKIAVKNAKNSE